MSVIFTSFPVAFWTGIGVGILLTLVLEFGVLFTIALKRNKEK